MIVAVNQTWDIWVYRINVGWWLEECGYDSLLDAVGGWEEWRKKNAEENNTDPARMQVAIVPAGCAPQIVNQERFHKK